MMTDETALKVFNDFLKEHGAYDAYWTNAAERNSLILPDDIGHIALALDHSGFEWELSQQGDDFWYGLHCIWVEEVLEFGIDQTFWRPVFELGLSQYLQLDESTPHKHAELIHAWSEEPVELKFPE